MDISEKREAYIAQVLSLLSGSNLLRASLAGTTRFEKSAIVRVTIRPVDLREGRRLQVSRNDGRKDLSTNHTSEELPAAIGELLAAGFANVHVSTTTEEIDLRLTKRGDVLVGRKPAARLDVSPAPAAHNRVKEVPLPEGRGDALLEAMGILDRNHRVRPTMRDKFTQINEFLKLLEHALPPSWQSPSGAPLTVLDCGCGSSLLTLAAAHFLALKNIPARTIGIDRNPEVIAKSRQRAVLLPNLQIEFRQATIGAVTDLQADIVLALHACDTATDDALVQAVRSHASLILAVPCCHKNLNAQLQVPALDPIHHHGILHQRLADIVTDTCRALLLEVMGYRTEVIEFISPEHTARNLMLRAVHARGIGEGDTLARYTRFKSFAAVTPYLEIALAGMLPAAVRAAPSVSP